MLQYRKCHTSRRFCLIPQRKSDLPTRASERLSLWGEETWVSIGNADAQPLISSIQTWPGTYERCNMILIGKYDAIKLQPPERSLVVPISLSTITGNQLHWSNDLQSYAFASSTPSLHVISPVHVINEACGIRLGALCFKSISYYYKTLSPWCD